MGRGEHDHLCERGYTENGEADRDGADPVSRANDRAVDEPVRVTVIVMMVVVVVVAVLVVMRVAVDGRLRRLPVDEVPVRAPVRMAVNVVSVPVALVCGRAAHGDAGVMIRSCGAPPLPLCSGK